MNNTHIQAANHEDFVSVFDKLLEKLFLEDKITDHSAIVISSDEIKRATWLASIAALGEGDREKNLANAYGALLHLNNPDSEIFKRACYVLQSRSGNLITSNHLPKLFENGNHLNDYGTALNFELAANRALLKQRFTDESEVYFTSFQKELWKSLSDGQNVAISAPTSAGKSFIIKKHISELVDHGATNILFIVPTKALINQVSNALKYDLKDRAHVLTTYIPNTKEDGKCFIFVLTPERCLKIFQDQEITTPSLVFIDEIHNIEDQARGTIFENALYRMIDMWRASQFVVAGPYIESLSKSIQQIGNASLIDHRTLSSPVFQIKAALTFSSKNKSADYKIASPTGNILSGKIKLKKSIYSKIKSNKGDALEVIADLFSPKDHNIYYAPSRKNAEVWAKKIAPVIASKNPDITEEADPRVKDLISFLADEVHPNYSLIRTLRLGVAYHHAGLPDIARQEVEELYIESHIKNLVCTSTLVQGVNLPADRLILITPKVDKYEMSDFDFLNLIGRAGRANTKLYGEIYCIDIVDDSWGEEKLTKETSKSVESSSTLFLRANEDILPTIATMTHSEIREVTDNKYVYENISYLRSVFQSDPEHFDRLLTNSGISKVTAKSLASEISKISSKMIIPSELIAKNPFIDPVLQNELFLSIQNEGTENWLISKLPVSKDGENSFDVPYSCQSYYYQFWTIFKKLNQIFDIEYELNKNTWSNDDYINIGKLVMDSHNWMKGKKHRFFMDEKIGNDANDDDKVDKAARYVTKHISKNITFIAVKYLMVWSDILCYFLSDKEIEENSYMLNIASMLEMGSYDPTTLELMSYGINRSVALAISSKVKKTQLPVEQALKELNKSDLHALFRRYLLKAGY